jgi:hypothetical protein
VIVGLALKKSGEEDQGLSEAERETFHQVMGMVRDLVKGLIVMRGCEQHPSAFGHPTDLLLALLRGQTGPVNVGLEAFELLIPPGLVLGPFPLDERSESLLRGESGPGVIFRQVVGENASEYAQQWVKSPVTV